jgi:hypothetical protein
MNFNPQPDDDNDSDDSTISEATVSTTTTTALNNSLEVLTNTMLVISKDILIRSETILNMIQQPENNHYMLLQHLFQPENIANITPNQQRINYCHGQQIMRYNEMIRNLNIIENNCHVMSFQYLPSYLTTTSNIYNTYLEDSKEAMIKIRKLRQRYEPHIYDDDTGLELLSEDLESIKGNFNINEVEDITPYIGDQIMHIILKLNTVISDRFEKIYEEIKVSNLIIALFVTNILHIIRRKKLTKLNFL